MPLPELLFPPGISIGGGFGHFGVADHLEFGGSNPGKGSNTGIFQMGLGLDVRVTHTFSVRGQVRDFWSGRPDLNLDTDKSRQHNFFVGGGVIWRFGKS